MEINGDEPQIRWKSTDLQSDISSPVVLDGYIYGCHGGPFPDSPYRSLRCLELETGRLMWENALGDELSTGSISLMAADGKLIVLNDQGALFLAEASPAGFL